MKHNAQEAHAGTA